MENQFSQYSRTEPASCRMLSHRSAPSSRRVPTSTRTTVSAASGRMRLNTCTQYVVSAFQRIGTPRSIFRVKDRVIRKAETNRKTSTPPETRPNQMW